MGKTRKQYMDGDCSHREYYAQFVTPSIKSFVLSRIDKEKLIKSTDKHLNDIPLPIWDGIGQLITGTASDLKSRMDTAKDYCTAADLVCIAKEAARQIIETGVK